MFDFRHPSFKPLWLRVLTLGILFGWGLYEFSTEAPFWGLLFCSMGCAALYQFFIRPADMDGDKDKNEDEG